MLSDLEARYGGVLPDFAARHQERLRRLFEADLRAIPGVTAVLDALDCQVCIASSGTPERFQHALSMGYLLNHFHPNIFRRPRWRAATGARPLPRGRADGRLAATCVVVQDSLPGVAAAVRA
jgi:beta-phosphoglucomutase-like phosphatase (HAD superfamily)